MTGEAKSDVDAGVEGGDDRKLLAKEEEGEKRGAAEEGAKDMAEDGDCCW